MEPQTVSVEQSCAACGKAVAMAEPTAGSEQDPHWAEAYSQRDDSFMVCWTCGKVLRVD